jgi:hypothetical protein
MFGENPSENDLDALENLTDFHVEYDHDKPNYRKVVAVSDKPGNFVIWGDLTWLFILHRLSRKTTPSKMKP